MPLHSWIHRAEDLRTGLWQITESETELLQGLQLSPEEAQDLEKIKNGLRRRQWMACRRALKEILGRRDFLPSGKRSGGAPFLYAQDWHISLTHTGEWAAASAQKNQVLGLDLELCRPKMLEINWRFLNPEELAWAKQHPQGELTASCMIWAAKEALIKMQEHTALDLREHIRVNPLPNSENEFRGGIQTSEGWQWARVRIFRPLYPGSSEPLFLALAVPEKA